MKIQELARREYESSWRNKRSAELSLPVMTRDDILIGSLVMFYRKGRAWDSPGKVYAITGNAIGVQHNASVYQVPLAHIRLCKDVVDTNLLAADEIASLQGFTSESQMKCFHMKLMRC